MGAAIASRDRAMRLPVMGGDQCRLRQELGQYRLGVSRCRSIGHTTRIDRQTVAGSFPANDRAPTIHSRSGSMTPDGGALYPSSCDAVIESDR